MSRNSRFALRLVLAALAFVAMGVVMTTGGMEVQMVIPVLIAVYAGAVSPECRRWRRDRKQAGPDRR